MRVLIQKFYDPTSDPNDEASKLDDFFRRLFGQGEWRRSQNGIEIIL